ncbi:cupin domain protein [Mycobacterium xenopi 3993]|nr:cupin domain protein [Mycobacterium xenopi 3993]
MRSGRPDFVFRDGKQEVQISASPGDYAFIPPYLPHREKNPSPAEPAVVVITRSMQAAVVVNLPALYPL